MPPILKRSRKPKDEEPDLATLLQPYGASEEAGSGEPVEADATQAATQAPAPDEGS